MDDIRQRTSIPFLTCWSFGTYLAIMYFVTVYWLFRGKVSKYGETYGY